LNRTPFPPIFNPVDQNRQTNTIPAYRHHPRQFDDYTFVYPVVSRRSRGISIGLNVNPDKACNFDCIYCQVDRTTLPTVTKFDLAAAESELREMISLVTSGEIAQRPPFDTVPRDLLRLNDIALSGDAEPTTLPNFSDTIAMIARVKPSDTKIVLITDAGGLDRSDVRKGLTIMDAHNGEVWAKLDAGTEDYYKLVNRSAIPFERILKNLTGCAKERPIVIQTLFMNIRGVGPSDTELGAYINRLRDIVSAGGQIKLVQIYTIARKPMTIVEGVPSWEFVTALANSEVDQIAERVRQEAGVSVETFYGK
jgi:wyosine [tRNA(Phe)-imidazoG37] synthetase (radical SAM superfamily)